MEALVHRLPMAHPGDVSALAALLQSGALDPSRGDCRNAQALTGNEERNACALTKRIG